MPRAPGRFRTSLCSGALPRPHGGRRSHLGKAVTDPEALGKWWHTIKGYGTLSSLDEGRVWKWICLPVSRHKLDVVMIVLESSRQGEVHTPFSCDKSG